MEIDNHEEDWDHDTIARPGDVAGQLLLVHLCTHQIGCGRHKAITVEATSYFAYSHRSRLGKRMELKSWIRVIGSGDCSVSGLESSPRSAAFFMGDRERRTFPLDGSSAHWTLVGSGSSRAMIIPSSFESSSLLCWSSVDYSCTIGHTSLLRVET